MSEDEAMDLSEETIKRYARQVAVDERCENGASELDAQHIGDAWAAAARWARDQMMPVWRTDDPREHGRQDRLILTWFGGGEPEFNCASVAGLGIWTSVHAWRELIPGVDFPLEGETQPAPEQSRTFEACEVGLYGKAYDGPGKCRAYTASHYPDNLVAWRLGCATDEASKDSSGDPIDRGLCLLGRLEAKGFGVFEFNQTEGSDGHG